MSDLTFIRRKKRGRDQHKIYFEIKNKIFKKKLQ